MDRKHRNPKLSIIIPVHNASRTLRGTLDALFASTYKDVEVILVDDASTDGCIALAAGFDCRIIKREHNRGPSVARNDGARAARGEILFFTDSDVQVLPDTLEKIVTFLEANPGTSALMGSYTINTPCTGFFSTFKNLLHHYTHQNSHETATTFWGACGAIYKKVFDAVEGFNEGFKTASIEDIEMGYRLVKAGYKMALVKDIQVIHLKEYTFWGLVRSDVFNRAIPWTALMLKEGTLKNDLNTTRGNAIALVAAYCVPLCLILASLSPYFLLGSVFFLLLLIACNRPFFYYAYRFKGMGFMSGTIAMNFVFYLYSGVGMALGVAAYLRGAHR